MVGDIDIDDVVPIQSLVGKVFDSSSITSTTDSLFNLFSLFENLESRPDDVIDSSVLSLVTTLNGVMDLQLCVQFLESREYNPNEYLMEFFKTFIDKVKDTSHCLVNLALNKKSKDHISVYKDVLSIDKKGYMKTPKQRDTMKNLMVGHLKKFLEEDLKKTVSIDGKLYRIGTH